MKVANREYKCRNLFEIGLYRHSYRTPSQNVKAWTRSDDPCSQGKFGRYVELALIGTLCLIFAPRGFLTSVGKCLKRTLKGHLLRRRIFFRLSSRNRIRKETHLGSFGIKAEIKSQFVMCGHVRGFLSHE